MAKSIHEQKPRQQLECVCGKSGGVTIRRNDRYGIRFLYKFCLGCGHVRTSDPLSTEDIVRFYSSSDYRSMYHSNDDPKSVILRKVPKANHKSELLKYVEGFRGTPGVIVEWGCGGGWNLVPFRDAGWTTYGVDYDTIYTELGCNLLGLSLFGVQHWNTVAKSVSPPDVILLNHVLEHSINPVQLLTDLCEVADTSTLIVVGVPLLETIKKWHWQNFFHIAHIHYFSSTTLRYVAESAGLELLDKDTKRGLFVFRKYQANSNGVVRLRRIFAIQASFHLLKGFMDIEYRTRLMVRTALRQAGLLGVVRSLRSRLWR